MLRINERYALNADNYNYILVKRVGTKDNTAPVGYYNTMRSLLNGFIEHQLREIVDNAGENLSLTELKAKIDQLYAQVDAACKKIEERGPRAFAEEK